VVRDGHGRWPGRVPQLESDTVTCRDSRGRVLWKLDNFLNADDRDVRDSSAMAPGHVWHFPCGKLDTFMVSGSPAKLFIFGATEKLGGQMQHRPAARASPESDRRCRQRSTAGPQGCPSGREL